MVGMTKVDMVWDPSVSEEQKSILERELMGSRRQERLNNEDPEKRAEREARKAEAMEKQAEK